MSATSTYEYEDRSGHSEVITFAHKPESIPSFQGTLGDRRLTGCNVRRQHSSNTITVHAFPSRCGTGQPITFEQRRARQTQEHSIVSRQGQNATLTFTESWKQPLKRWSGSDFGTRCGIYHYCSIGKTALTSATAIALEEWLRGITRMLTSSSPRRDHSRRHLSFNPTATDFLLRPFAPPVGIILSTPVQNNRYADLQYSPIPSTVPVG